MTYRVLITEPAMRRIEAQAVYIERETQLPLRAAQWLTRVLAAATSLETIPRRCPVRREADADLPEFRALLVDGFVLLFTIDDAQRRVVVFHARHARQMSDESTG